MRSSASAKRWTTTMTTATRKKNHSSHGRVHLLIIFGLPSHSHFSDRFIFIYWFSYWVAVYLFIWKKQRQCERKQIRKTITKKTTATTTTTRRTNKKPSQTRRMISHALTIRFCVRMKQERARISFSFFVLYCDSFAPEFEFSFVHLIAFGIDIADSVHLISTNNYKFVCSIWESRVELEMGENDERMLLAINTWKYWLKIESQQWTERNKRGNGTEIFK